jgi:hypothetical protein
MVEEGQVSKFFFVHHFSKVFCAGDGFDWLNEE